MTPSRVWRSAALGAAMFATAAHAQERPRPVFSCANGDKRVSVTEAGGRYLYRFQRGGKEELSILGDPAAGNIFWMMQRYAGEEYQLRFTRGEFSYIVFSSEGNASVGASATSGLVVMRGAKRISDLSCARFANFDMPANAADLPQDTDAFSAM